MTRTEDLSLAIAIVFFNHYKQGKILRAKRWKRRKLMKTYTWSNKRFMFEMIADAFMLLMWHCYKTDRSRLILEYWEQKKIYFGA